jgi:hypothetical protein
LQPTDASEAPRTVQGVFTRNQPIEGFLNRELALAPVPELPDDVQAIAATIIRPDTSWRVIDVDVFADLGWQPGARIAFARTRAGYTLNAVGTQYTGAAKTIDGRHRLLLPRTVREALLLIPGQPLLLLADTARGSACLTTLATIHHALKESA